MPKAHLTLLFVLSAAVSSAAPDTLPKGVSDDVRKTVQKAERAVEQNDYQLALALYEGALYSSGISIAIDAATIDYFDQQDSVRFAISTWSDELDGDFPVKLVDDPKKADVVLSFVDSLKLRSPDALGLINLRKNYRWNSFVHEVSYSGTIQIVRSAGGKALSQAETIDVVMHELGHLLGLGDTSNVGVLMGPLRRGHPLYRPTRVEVENVETLRALLKARIGEVQAMVSAERASNGGDRAEPSRAYQVQS